MPPKLVKPQRKDPSSSSLHSIPPPTANTERNLTEKTKSDSSVNSYARNVTQTEMFTHQFTQNLTQQPVPLPPYHFGSILLFQCTDVGKKFRPYPGLKIDQQQQCLIDNLWHVQTISSATTFKVQCLNALCYYFQEINNRKKEFHSKFSHYVIYRGLKTGVFHSFDTVRKHIMCPHPVYKGYTCFSDALNAARETLGLNFYIEPEQVQSYAEKVQDNSASASIITHLQHQVQALQNEIQAAQKREENQLCHFQQEISSFKQKIECYEEQIAYKDHTVTLLEKLLQQANAAKQQLEVQQEENAERKRKRTFQQLRHRLLDLPPVDTLEPLFQAFPQVESILSDKTEQSLLQTFKIKHIS